MKKINITLGAILILLALSGCGIGGNSAAGSEADLSGTSWTLESYGGKSLLDETAMTARFLLGEITGTTSCNQYFGAYQAKGDQLTIEDLGWTEMACLNPEGIMEQERDIMALLSDTASYELEGDTLRLQTSTGEVLNFTPADQDN